MDIKIDQDILQGRWTQVKGKIKQHWARLTDDDIDRLQGRSEELAGLLQENYGYTKARARQAVHDFVRHIDRVKEDIHQDGG